MKSSCTPSESSIREKASKEDFGGGREIFMGGSEGAEPPEKAFSRMELSLGVQLDFIALIDLHQSRGL